MTNDEKFESAWLASGLIKFKETGRVMWEAALASQGAEPAPEPVLWIRPDPDYQGTWEYSHTPKDGMFWKPLYEGTAPAQPAPEPAAPSEPGAFMAWLLKNHPHEFVNEGTVKKWFVEYNATAHPKPAAQAAAVPEAVERDAGWQPIETAPKDGTDIWVLDELLRKPWHYECNWNGFEWYHGFGDAWPTAKPTHWMPLPKPPAIDRLAAPEAGAGGGKP